LIPPARLHAVYRVEPCSGGNGQSPRQYQWSSYRLNAFGQLVSGLSCHEAYCRLGEDENARQSAYRALFDAHVDKNELSDIRRCYKTGTPLGNDYFKARVEQKLKCRVGYDRRGRPGKGV